jgi:type II secretory pathway pseudopilin PulG
MSRRAFTLIELLVVIGIMITLMSLIMGGVMLAKRSAMRAKTTASISAMASAIDQYRSLNNTYPELWIIPATPPAEWTTAQGRSTWLGGLSTPKDVYKEAFEGGRPTDDKVWEGINVQLVYQLGSLITDQAKDGKVLDAYKTPLRYRPSKWYPYTAGAAARIDSDNPPGQDSYQLWSAGTDTKDDANPGEGGDDIPQWAKQ